MCVNERVRFTRLTLVVVIASAFGACGAEGDGTTIEPEVRSTATPALLAMPPVIALNAESEIWPTAGINGTLVERAGCLFIGADVAVFPYGTTWEEPDVVFSDGTRVTVGSRVRLGGGQYEVAAGGSSIVPMSAVKACAQRSDATYYVWAMP